MAELAVGLQFQDMKHYCPSVNTNQYTQLDDSCQVTT